MRPIPVDTELLDRLAERSGRDLASVLMPTHSKGRDVAQDPIRLKNQISEVDDHLEYLGWRRPEREARLARVRSLLDDREFWEHQSAGLALYIDDEGEVTPVAIPVSVHTDWYVGQVFHLRHLVPGMGTAALPILVITQNSVRMVQGSKFVLRETESDLPRSFQDVNWFVDRETQRQQHPDRTGTSRNRHGHEPSSRAHEDMDRFLRAIADALPDAIGQGPLVVLGDDDIVSRFRRLVDAETLSPEHSGVGNPEDDALIHEMAVPMLEEVEQRVERQALERAVNDLGVGQAVTTLDEALPAAISGRVGEVVVRRGAAPVWGRVDATDMSVEIHDGYQTGDVDLLDRLVVEVRGNGGNVTTVEASPDGDQFVARFRF